MKSVVSVKRNYIYNLLLTVMNVAFPLITYPYVSRILGPANIGKVNWAFSFVSYFIMISSLGIPVFGIREIAKWRHERESRSDIASNIIAFNFLTALLLTLPYFACVFLVDAIQAERQLFLIFGTTIFLNVFSLDWIYAGMESYGFITLRNACVKVLTLAGIFLLCPEAGGLRDLRAHHGSLRFG